MSMLSRVARTFVLWTTILIAMPALGPTIICGVAVLAMGTKTAVAQSQSEDVKLLSSDGAQNISSDFGQSVAIIGDMLLVGAFRDDNPTNSGAVFVYQLQGANWVEVDKLKAPDAMAEDRFGFRMAVSGNVVVIGAEFGDGLEVDLGAAYIYRFDGVNWNFEQKLIPGDTNAGGFGRAVSVHQDLIAIGTPAKVFSVSPVGAVHVFRFDGSAWAQEPMLVISPAPTPFEEFGFSVGVFDDVLLAGAPGGAAGYVYRFDTGSGSWIFEQQFPSGNAAALDGNVAVVGNGGSASYFRYDGSSWVSEGGGVFGFAVSVDEDRLIQTESNNAIPDGGGGSVKGYDGATWNTLASLRPSDGITTNLYGWSSDIEGDLAVVGARRAQNGNGTVVGAVYLYYLADCNMNSRPDSIDILDGTSLDNDFDGIPDECLDCDLDGTPDAQEIAEGAQDCDFNGVPDECQPGWENNQVIDACDCNSNGEFDSEDISSGPSTDNNLNGLPDECDTIFNGEMRWMNPLGGQFGDFLNWDIFTPISMNPAVFDLDATYTVDFHYDVVNYRLNVAKGNVTFQMFDGLTQYAYELQTTASPSVVVGDLAGDNASLTILDGLITSDAVRIGNDAGSIGALTFDGPTSFWLSSDTFSIGGTGTGFLTIRNGAMIECRDAIVGDEPGSFGDVLVTDPGSLWLNTFLLIIDNGTVNVSDGATLEVTFGDIFIFGDGQLGGDGTINASILNSGMVTPGNSPGVLTVNGDYSQIGLGDVAGVLSVEVQGTLPGVEHDVLSVAGIATLGGGLVVNLLNGFEPTQGQSFNIISAPFSTGTFSVALMPGFPDDRFIRVNYGAAGAANSVFGPGVVNLSVDVLGSVLDFGDPDILIVNGLPTDSDVGDFDDDGDLDIVVSIPSGSPTIDGSAVILLNAGNDAGGNWLGFSGTLQLTVGRGPSAVIAGFFDGDALLDLAVTNLEDSTVSILLNTGVDIGNNPTFNNRDTITVGAQPSNLDAEDFASGNGLDLIVTNRGDDTISLLINDGSGVFAANPAIAVDNNAIADSQPSAIAVGDYDRNGTLDVAVTNRGTGTISMLFGLGTGGFISPIIIPVDDGPIDIDPSDIDNDKDLDLITANFAAGTISVLLNDSTGSFSPAVNFQVGTQPRSLTTFDMDGDADQDIAVIVNDETGQSIVQVLRNDTVDMQTVVFSKQKTIGAGEDPVLVVSGDIDDDGSEDLITINRTVLPASLKSLGLKSTALGTMSDVAVRLNVSGVFCPSDTNGDNTVNVTDLLSLLAAWGSCGSPCPHDTNFDGTVNVLDLLDMLAAWGGCP